ncbi:hypothetical protein [Bradyrhizobium sp. WU425]|uniref:hypothetical protein n=1 Tax=Bradyrhizobium sp. WU425 TaxID=187029 RepID=UPI001E2B7964|nr:hypothetical protein [Bradyrhizobium canariense]UFW72865.1 hypothetical protein BcanWU425_03595 [Bradyrhizobium canariense]
MSKVVYTIFIAKAAGPAADDVVTRGVKLPRALVQALEDDARSRATIVHGDIAPLQNFGGHLGAGRAMQVVVPDPDEAVEQWLAAPIERWGRAALCDLLAGFVDPEIDERLYAEMTAGRDVREAFEHSVDWTRFADLAAARRRPPMPVVAGMPAQPRP